MKRFLSALLLLLAAWTAAAQEVRLAGHVTDASTGQPLPEANVYLPDKGMGQTTDRNGRFRLTLPARQGVCRLSVSYVGYRTQQFTLRTDADTLLQVRLVHDNRLPDVQVYAPRHDFGVQNSQMSAIELPVAQVKSLPALFGETDVMKALQRLPGVQSAGDGNAGIYVRGGNYDQNLITLDGSTLYNSDHLNGFVSALNADMVQNILFYKGAFPARYGSRLSGVLDIGMREGDYERYHGSLTAGMLSARVQLEGPIRRGTTSFNVGARASYFDAVVQPLLRKVYDKPDALQPYSHMNYYDVNAKLVHRFSDRDKLSAVFYWGKDVNDSSPTDSRQAYNAAGKEGGTYLYENEKANRTENDWGNLVSSLFWTHRGNEAFTVNTNLNYSHYRYRLHMAAHADNRSTVVEHRSLPAGTLKEQRLEDSYSTYHSGIGELALTTDFRLARPGSSHDLRWGAKASGQRFTPIVDVYKYTFHRRLNDNNPGDYTTEEHLTDTILGRSLRLYTLSAYLEDDWTLAPRWKANVGLRYMHAFVEDKSYPSLEPRVSLRWLARKDMALKASYSRMSQAIHLLSSSNLVMSSDLWVPVTADIPLMTSDQWALGWQWEVAKGVDLALEGYYKTMDNVIDYREGASYMNASGDWQDMVAVGSGRAYGVELLLQKKTGRTTGWLAYTWSKALRTYDRPGQEISGGQEFYDGSDCRNNVNLVVSHRFNRHWEVSGTWTYQTGRRGILSTTALYGGWLDEYDPYGNLTSGSSWQGGDGTGSTPDGATYLRRFSRFYSFRERNGYKLPATHRLDVSVSYTYYHETARSVLNFSIYNLYNRQNVSNVYIGYDNNRTVLKGICMLPFMPSLSYTLKF